MATNHSLTVSRNAETTAAVLVAQDVEHEGSEPICRLELQLAGVAYTASGPDFFEALICIREQVEPSGILLHVYGCSRNVWPSGMSRSMGLGVKAYKMTMGKQALKQDMVSIFVTGSDVEPVTVAEQEQFKNEWFASLGQET